MKSKALLKTSLFLLVIGIIVFIVGSVMIDFDYSYINQVGSEKKIVNYKKDLSFYTEGKTIIKTKSDLLDIEIYYDKNTNVSNDESEIKVIDSYSFWNIFECWSKTNVIYIPEGEYDSININGDSVELSFNNIVCDEIIIKNNASSINIKDSLINKLSCNINAGDIDLIDSNIDIFNGNLNAGSIDAENIITKVFTVKIDAGEINALFKGNEEEYKILANVSVGESNVDSNDINSDKVLDIKVRAGEINVNFE